MKNQRRTQLNRQLQRQHRGQERFLQVPTPHQAGRIAHMEAGKEYNPTIRGLRSEGAASHHREGELKDWYGALGNQIAQNAQKAAAASQAQEAALTQRLANAGASDQSSLQAAAARNEGLSKLLGAPQNVSGLQNAALGNQALAQQRIALTAPVGAERTNYQNYLGNRGVSAAERGITAVKAEGLRGRKIREDLRAGQKEKGEAQVADLEKLREGARDYNVQLDAFGQKAREFGAEQRENALERRQKALENAQDVSQKQTKLGFEARKTRVEEQKLQHGGLTPYERHKAREDQRNAISTARGIIASNGRPKSQKEWAGLETLVRKESEVSPANAARAVRRLRQHIEARERRRAQERLGHLHR